MKLIKGFITAAILISTISAYGQIRYEAEEKPYIEVTGTADKEVIPDEIFIRIVLKERYNNKEKISIEQQDENLRNAIKALGINLSNLSLSDANADYVKIQRKKKDVITMKDYTLKVTDANTVDKVFQELDKLMITDAYISKVDYSKMDSLKKK